jgi:hypothetical protein
MTPRGTRGRGGPSAEFIALRDDAREACLVAARCWLRNALVYQRVLSLLMRKGVAEFSYLLPVPALYSDAPATLLNVLRDDGAGMDSWRQLWHFR